MGPFHVWVDLWAGNEYKGLGAGWERVQRSGDEFACAQHTCAIVYRLLEVADPVIAAVCLHPPCDASVSPGVQWSEGAPRLGHPVSSKQ